LYRSPVQGKVLLVRATIFDASAVIAIFDILAALGVGCDAPSS
jgi:hypothetical protein